MGMLSKAWLGAMIVLAVTMAGPANATLIDRGGGLIYDDFLDITWLQDANYSYTSGYDEDGRMDWYDAMAWAESLTFGGYENWRLPTALGGFCNFGYSGTNCGYNVSESASELTYMFYYNLGNTAVYDTSGNQVAWPTFSGSANGVDILNIKPSPDINNNYWIGTGYFDSSNAWVLDTRSGYLNTAWKENVLFAWAVHDGDIAPIPEPTTLALFAFGLAGLGFMNRRRRESRL